MFMHPYISSELARDRQRELLARASRQRLAVANGKKSSRPGTIMIRIAFAAAVLGALAAGLTKAHSDQDHVGAPDVATVATSGAHPFTGTGIAPISLTGDDWLTPVVVLTADEHSTLPATGRRQHQPLVQKVRYNGF